MLGAFLGPTPVCLAAFLTLLTAGTEVGDHRWRHWSVYATGGHWS